MNTLPLHDPTRLVADLDFVRSLARQLCRDTHTAEDVAQQTLTAALEKPPQSGSNGRGWLAVVTRNMARRHVRGERRRKAREHVVASQGDEPLPSAAEVAEREQLRSRVVQAVLGLPDPYRTTLLLRHYRGHDVARCAKELEVSESTVRTRLSRGLQKLRERLDAEHRGDRQKWMAGLLPFALPDGGGKAAASFGIGMGLWLGAAALLLGVLGWVILADPAVPVPQAGTVAQQQGPTRADQGAEPQAATAAIEAERQANQADRQVFQDPTRDWLQHGVARTPNPQEAFAWLQVADATVEVFAVDGPQPRADARKIATATTDANGQFTVDLSTLLALDDRRAASTWVFCSVDAAGFAPLVQQPRPVRYQRAARTPWNLDLQACVGIRGRVVGADQRPLANATVYRVLDGARNGAITDLFGRYLISPLADDRAGTKVTVFASHPKFGISEMIHTVTQSRRDTPVRDLRVSRFLSRIEGKLTDRQGNPQAGVQLQLHPVRRPEGADADAMLDGVLVRKFWHQSYQTVTTDERGRFFARNLHASDYRITNAVGAPKVTVRARAVPEPCVIVVPDAPR